MIRMPPDLQNMVIKADLLTAEIKLLRNKKSLSIVDLRRLAGLQVDLRALMPPERFAFVDALPVIDILKSLHTHQNEKEI